MDCHTNCSIVSKEFTEVKMLIEIKIYIPVTRGHLIDTAETTPILYRVPALRYHSNCSFVKKHILSSFSGI